MARAKQPTKRERRQSAIREMQQRSFDAAPIEPVIKKSSEPITARTQSQKEYLKAIKTFPVVFATGPAGTGKTFICSAIAAEMLDKKEVEKIYITRPAVEAGENLGFLPGELENKIAPFMLPFLDVLYERLGKGYTEYLVKCGRIEAAPFAYMRGRTFKSCVVILDEAQNVTPTQMQLFLTRMGENCKVVVNGDLAQKDIPGMSGLEDAIKRLSYIPMVKHVEFTKLDIVRSGLCAEIAAAYGA